MPEADPKPGDLVVRRNRWSIFSHVLGLVVQRDGVAAVVWWSPTEDTKTCVGEHIADALIVVGDSNAEELRLRCLLAP